MCTRSIWPVKIKLALDSWIYVLNFKQCQFNYTSGLPFAVGLLCPLHDLSISLALYFASLSLSLSSLFFSLSFCWTNPLHHKSHAHIIIQWIICYQFFFVHTNDINNALSTNFRVCLFLALAYTILSLGKIVQLLKNACIWRGWRRTRNEK